MSLRSEGRRGDEPRDCPTHRVPMVRHKGTRRGKPNLGWRCPPCHAESNKAYRLRAASRTRTEPVQENHMTTTADPVRYDVGNPRPRSITERRTLANKARKALAAFQVLLDPGHHGRDTQEALDTRVLRLLWAQAHIEQALFLETGGKVGDEHATPRRILRRAAAAKAAR